MSCWCWCTRSLLTKRTPTPITPWRQSAALVEIFVSSTARCRRGLRHAGQARLARRSRPALASPFPSRRRNILRAIARAGGSGIRDTPAVAVGSPCSRKRHVPGAVPAISATLPRSVSSASHNERLKSGPARGASYVEGQRSARLRLMVAVRRARGRPAGHVAMPTRGPRRSAPTCRCRGYNSSPSCRRGRAARGCRRA